MQNQEAALDQDQFLFANVDQSVSLDSSVLDYAPPQNFQASGFSGASFDPMDDIGLLESLEGPNWWAQLDSWVSGFAIEVEYIGLTYFPLQAFTNPSNDPSMFIF